jgi:hypothetical protein
MKVLTKSRFKLGLECPNKLHYTSKKEYNNQQVEDPFLMALAEGGFQVEEYARMHFPGGTLIDRDRHDYESLWEETQELLKNENVIIYEAAFLHDGLFIRTDILVKKGNQVQLIEVKSKSYDPSDDNLFIGKRGGLVGGWKPYLFDIAFQKHVISLCYPELHVTSHIMMANKQSKSSIDGLNQCFRVSKNASNRTGIEKKVDSIDQLGHSVLGKINISVIIDDIIGGNYKYSDSQLFSESIDQLKENYLKDFYPESPLSYKACKNCEFKTTKEQDEQGLKSGYAECFHKLKGLDKDDLGKPNIFDVWFFRKGEKLFEKGVFFLDELDETDVDVNEVPHRLTMSHRQWIQIEKAVNKDDSIHVEKDSLQQEIDSWKYPLHFIDFETSAVALPFHKYQRPYEQVAFQFSHHIMYESGDIKHADQFLCVDSGVFPNFRFVRALRDSLMTDSGSIFRYASHENSILNNIYNQLAESDEPDKNELMEFIRTITHSTRDSVESWEGDRDMVDLLEVVKSYYYNPYTNGPNSLKVILPASLNSSPFLKEKYSRPLKDIGLTSLNHSGNHVWLDFDDNEVINPYMKLPSLHQGWTEEEIENSISGMDSISDGGAALTAYGKLQYTDMVDKEREELCTSLLKYCELDTLAMVMIAEHFLNDLV